MKIHVSLDSDGPLTYRSIERANTRRICESHCEPKKTFSSVEPDQLELKTASDFEVYVRARKRVACARARARVHNPTAERGVSAGWRGMPRGGTHLSEVHARAFTYA